MPLPVPADTMRVRLRAVLLQGGAAVEEAQFGFWGVRVHFSGNGTDWASDCQEVAEGVRDAWNEHITGKGYWSTLVRMDTVTVDHLEAASGKTLDQGQATFAGADAWQGSGADSMPWETTVCVSMFGYGAGFTQNKGRKRGRFYLPPPSTSFLGGGDAGQVGAGNLEALTTQVTAFLNEVQGLHMGDTAPPNDDDYFDLRVVSRGTPENVLPPTSTPITRIRIDSRVDSQRRREHQQPVLASYEGAIAHS